MRFIEHHGYLLFVPWRLLGGLLFFALACMTYTLTRIVAGSADHTGVTPAALNALFTLGLGVLCLQGLQLRSALSCSWQSNGWRLSPLLLGVCLFCSALSQLIWLGSLLLPGGRPAYPLPAQLAVYALYLPFISAILLLLRGNVAHWSRLRLLLDALMIMVVVITLCSALLPAPLLSTGATGTPLAGGVNGGLLAADLALMFTLLLVALRSGETALRPVLVMLFLALLVMLLMHIVQRDNALSPGLRAFSRAEAGWPLAGTLLVGAARTTTHIVNATTAEPGERIHPGQANRERLPVVPWRWQSVLPPLLVLIFSLVILVIWIDGQAFAGQLTMVYAAGFVVLTLMVLRQMLTLLQISVLHRQLQTKHCTLQVLNRQLEQQAITDPLTGLPNHRALVEALDAALRIASSEQAACAVIFMDVDHLKAINDRHGHTTGDRVLYRFGEMVRAILPAGACVGRWGGGEFVALLPRSDPSEARALAERIRSCVAHAHQTRACAPPMTCSLGVAGYPQDACSREELLVNADRAMDAARRLGCNQVREAHEAATLAMSTASVAAEAVEREEMLAVVDALLALLEVRDPALSLHSRRVSALSLKLALLLGLGGSETYLVALAGLLHDTGKAALPDHVLWQRDWPDDTALNDMLRHPLMGARILAPIPTLQAVTSIVRTHHEHLDGSGYPDGLHAEEISLEARIVSVADAYDALTSCSPFHPAHSPGEALRELQKEADLRFDRRVVEALFCLLATGARRSGCGVA